MKRRSLARRLLTAQALPLTGMGAAVLAAMVVIGPPIFEQHMRMAGHEQPDVLAHGDAAFVWAGVLSVALGLLLGLGGVLTATVVVTRRLGRALTALEDGAARVAAGDYSRPVPLIGADSELMAVATAFNAMAERIASTESVRRRLLTDVAHELRTPVAAIGLLSEAVQDGAVEPADAWPAIEHQTRCLTRLAEDLRDVSASAEHQLVLRPEPTVVDAVVRTVVATTASARAAELSIRLLTDLDAPRPLLVDGPRLGQVLDNLVRNALQHTPHGGVVTVRTATNLEAVQIHVADTGPGIAEADLPHVFDRFYRGRDQRRDGGIGVGLSISRAIVEAHGGTLVAANRPGAGAEFVVTLCRQEPSA